MRNPPGMNKMQQKLNLKQSRTGLKSDFSFS